MIARGLTLRRGAKAVVHEVDLQVAPGEVLAVLGPNGAGKSTLLDALAGSLAPAAGTVSLSGRPLSAWAPRELARHRAVLPQSSTLSFPFDVRDVVALGRAPHRDGDSRDIVLACLDEAGIRHLAHRSYARLSGGEQQRVHLARVLAQLVSPARPRFLLLDEPVNHLDPAHQHHVLAVARRLALFEHVGVVAVLHDLNLASAYADRLAVLVDGRLVACGPPDRVLTAPLLRQAFGLDAEIIHPFDRPQVLVRPLGADRTASRGVRRASFT